MPDTSLTYRNKFLQNQKGLEKRYRPIFLKVARDVGLLVVDPSARFVKAFSYKNAPRLVAKMGDIILDFENKTLKVTEDAVKMSWALADQKNTAIVEDYLKNFVVPKKFAGGLADPDPELTALADYLKSGGSESLSDAVWQVSKQLRWEMDTHLAIGIANGDSADTISQRIRQYLNNPDALFRRVRDESGNLVASQRMKDYHPGRGVYKSAYKNALRVARTETNRAYLIADHERWVNNPLVTGISISLSESHPDYNEPEICEELEGDYPKDFVFGGWHPQCLCHATPIMADKQDFRAWLRGEAQEPTDQIEDMPKNFEDFIKDNYDTFENYKTMPYFVSDNQSIVDDIIG